MKKVVGLSGLKTAGKTTAFNLIKDMHPEVVEVQFAKKLKDECAKILKIDRELFDDPDRKELDLPDPIYLDSEKLYNLIEAYGYKADYDTHIRPHIGMTLDSPRRVAQYVGTEVLRALNPDVHCIAATEHLPADGFFVVTDMRFPNELEFLAKTYSRNFTALYIQSNRAESTGAKDLHPSERLVLETAKKCKPVPNNGSMQELKVRLQAELDKLA